MNVNGILYGTTTGGGAAQCNGGGCDSGTVFSFDPATGAENVLYSFCNRYANQQCLDGDNPMASLTPVTDMNNNTILYGTAERGGAYNSNCGGCGLVFSVNSTTGGEQTEYLFQGGSDGLFPVSDLTNVNGTLYGTTPYGGDHTNCGPACGTVFAISNLEK